MIPASVMKLGTKRKGKPTASKRVKALASEYVGAFHHQIGAQRQFRQQR
jgi:hypothetical protein